MNSCRNMSDTPFKGVHKFIPTQAKQDRRLYLAKTVYRFSNMVLKIPFYKLLKFFVQVANSEKIMRNEDILFIHCQVLSINQHCLMANCK